MELSITSNASGHADVLLEVRIICDTIIAIACPFFEEASQRM